MVPPRNWARITEFPTEVWGVDNNCFKYGDQWSWDTFSKWLTQSPHNAGCKFVTAPDVMADARATLPVSYTHLTLPKKALADSVDGTHLAYTKPEFVQTIDSWLRHSDLLQSRLI